ncbi:chemotaxis protein CheA [Leptospira sp. 2 VSF19]|uniref:Chemotaxis protein CheA n=1 Tax=Leptospira soteropolitanensis TaxID=2950025 RepID=A0AAW5VQK5_9LEPT|nr:chemotaxis protein CheA [Leptospira soteropolitanensis]MCW7493961.1 chemotaxis protein CheA [Leptospira soteropolitanensis]MCW7501555.1 chemotaxis protein CheA [Leptospira soteropolitanensis]MCW7523683.1 chemotaxis protein CheA [Leptospira soteropolitanensis]MCW7527546.1 chemotaxis protein CheA [Leptospira soteropolitanensis]MCW7531400.1 chemotaxis protein CheA [Leptospira soteropolitanensis]
MDRDDVLEYLHEARETLENIEKELLQFEKSTLDGSLVERELLDTLFRHFHTIKGSSGFFGLSAIVKMAHAAENLLDYLRNHPEAQDKDTLELLITTLDHLNELVEHEENSPSGGDFFNESQIHFLEKLNEKNNDIRVRQTSTLETPESKHNKPEFGLFIESSKPEVSKEFGLFTEDSDQSRKEEFGLFTNSDSTITIDTIPKSEESPKSEKKFINKKDIRIDTDKLDSLLDIVGEIVITEPMVTDHPDIAKLKLENFQKTALQLKKLIRNLQEITLSLRMVPIAGIFSRMERLVRDTAKKTGKQVRLVISGEDTEIDKSIIEEMYDPLVHILRNAIDHGLETPEERKEAGKQPQGIIQLTATQSGKEVWIEVKDDGKGLSREKILNKAISLGLLGRSDAENLEDKDVWEFLFHPGFSTAKEITDLSGRGVGLDVVRKNVTTLKGFVDVFSIYGQGTTFLIRVPLTLAIIEGLVVRKSDTYFILPSIDVKETIYIGDEPINELYKNNHSIQYRTNQISIVDINLLFGKDSDLNNQRSLKEKYLIVTESHEKQMGIVFDEILGSQSIVIKPISPIFRNINGLAGCTILGNGHAGLILDVRKLISQHLSSVTI